MDTRSLRERYQAAIVLGIAGDKIGFGNGETEFFTGDVMKVDDYPDLKTMGEQITMTMVFVFIANGGIQGLDLSKLNFSDDSVMMLDNIKGILAAPDGADAATIADKIADEYLKSFSNMDEMVNMRLAGRQTISSMQSIMDGKDWRDFPYSHSAGGSGGSMRGTGFGLVYHRPEDLDALIQVAVESCAVTHNNGVAFMGSITSAFFTALALQGVNPVTWAGRLLELIDGERVQKYLKKRFPRNWADLSNDIKKFRAKWARYIEDSIRDDEYIVALDSLRSISPAHRMSYYYTNFSEVKSRYFPGAGSDDSVIIAYDTLLLSGNNFEKLIYNAMIHVGDSDTTGILAASWYGAYYGFANVPSPILDTFIDADDFRKLADKVYDRFCKHDAKPKRSTRR